MTTTAYSGRWLVDGVQDHPIENGVVIVDGARIVGVGPIAIPSAARHLDLGNVTLMPGLIDCHVHLPFDGGSDPIASFKRLSIPAATLAAVNHAQALLRKGVTTVRDVSTPYGISIALRDAIEAGKVAGPTIVASGTHLCMTGGQASSIGIEVDGPYEVRRAARLQFDAGADLIKVMGTGGVYSMGHHEAPEDIQLELNELREAALVAHRIGRRVAVHAEGSDGIELALNANLDTIEHGNMLTDTQARRMANEGKFLIPTVGAFTTSARRTDAPAEYVNNAQRMARGSANALRHAREYAVKVACGTDRGTVSGMPWDGAALVDEMRFMVELGGYRPIDALRSATSVGAEALGVESRLGSLREGLAADLVVVAGNVLEDIGALARPALVVKNGKFVAGELLHDDGPLAFGSIHPPHAAPAGSC